MYLKHLITIFINSLISIHKCKNWFVCEKCSTKSLEIKAAVMHKIVSFPEKEKINQLRKSKYQK